MTEKNKKPTTTKKKPLPKKPASKRRGRPPKAKKKTPVKKKPIAKKKVTKKVTEKKGQTRKTASKKVAKKVPKKKPKPRKKPTSTRTKKPKKPLAKDKLKKEAKGGRERAKTKAEKIEEQTRLACQYERLQIYSDGSVGSDDIFDEQFHCALVLALFQTGVLETELPIEMGINPATLYYWAVTFPQFRTALKMGRIISRSWWVSQGRRNIGNPFFNTKLYSFMMVNNFEWATKMEPEELLAKFRDFNLIGESENDGPDYENMDKELLELLDNHVCTINGDSAGKQETQEQNPA